MEEKPFDEPVILELGDAGGRRRIGTTKEASECLMTSWPPDRGPRHRDAVDTCLKVLDGHRSIADAREALIAAAVESKVLASRA
jgi:hypothetical protein